MNAIFNILCEIRNILAPVQDAFRDIEGTTKAVRRKNDNAQVIATENRARIEIWLHNKSNFELHIGFSNDLTTNRYAIRLEANDTLVLNANSYVGTYKNKIYGFWSSGADPASACMVTEFYKVSEV